MCKYVFRQHTTLYRSNNHTNLNITSIFKSCKENNLYLETCSLIINLKMRAFTSQSVLHISVLQTSVLLLLLHPQTVVMHSVTCLVSLQRREFNNGRLI